MVTLGPASHASIAMGPRRRDVQLSGIAAFKVVHDANRPFIVRTALGDARDLGTQFVVRAYETDSTVEVAVSEGRVELRSLRGQASKVELAPGEAAVLVASGAIDVRRGVDVARATAWTSGRLVFDDVAFRDVAAELSRWFDVEIRIADPALAARRVSAVYSNPSLEGVLDALAAGLGASHERQGRTVTFRVERR
jgi:transmembrane sensor